MSLESVLLELGLTAYAPKLARESIDIEALALLTPGDLRSVCGLPLGDAVKLIGKSRTCRYVAQGAISSSASSSKPKFQRSPTQVRTHVRSNAASPSAGQPVKATIGSECKPSLQIVPDLMAWLGTIDNCLVLATCKTLWKRADLYASLFADFSYDPALFQHRPQQTRIGRQLTATRAVQQKRFMSLLLSTRFRASVVNMDLCKAPAQSLETRSVQSLVGKMQRLRSVVLPACGWSANIERQRLIAALPRDTTVECELVSSAHSTDGARQRFTEAVPRVPNMDAEIASNRIAQRWRVAESDSSQSKSLVRARAADLVPKSKGSKVSMTQLALPAKVKRDREERGAEGERLALRDIIPGYRMMTQSSKIRIASLLRELAAAGQIRPKFSSRMEWNWHQGSSDLPVVRACLEAAGVPFGSSIIRPRGPGGKFVSPHEFAACAANWAMPGSEPVVCVTDSSDNEEGMGKNQLRQRQHEQFSEVKRQQEDTEPACSDAAAGVVNATPQTEAAASSPPAAAEPATVSEPAGASPKENQDEKEFIEATDTAQRNPEAASDMLSTEPASIDVAAPKSCNAVSSPRTRLKQLVESKNVSRNVSVEQDEDDDMVGYVYLWQLFPGWCKWKHKKKMAVHTHLREGAKQGCFQPRSGPYWRWRTDDPELNAVRDHLAELF